MSITTEIQRLRTNVNNIRQNTSDILDAIANKGVTVPAGSNLDDCAGLISQIETGGGGADIEGHIYPVIDIGYGTEFLGAPLQFIPKNNNFSQRDALDSHLYYNGYDLDYLDNYFSAPDSWRVPDENDLTHLKQYLDSNSIVMYSNPDFGSPKYYIDNNRNLQMIDAYIWGKIENGYTNLLRLASTWQDVITNTAPYNGAKYLVYLCRDKQ